MVVQEAANNIGSIGLNNNSRQLAHNIQNYFPSAHRKTNSSDNHHDAFESKTLNKIYAK
jgi:hypothetical protein